MHTALKSLMDSSFAKFLKKRYIPVYILVFVLAVFLVLFLLMQQTTFAKDTELRGYFEDIGIVPEVEVLEDSSVDEVVVEDDASTEENEQSDDEQGEDSDEEIKDEIDSASKVENPEDDSQGTGVISISHPTIISVKDGLGNVNYSSFGQENTGKWVNPSIKVEEELNITVKANNPNDTTLYYKFEYQVPGGSFITLQNWSTDNTVEWTIPSSALGRWLYIMVLVKDNDGVLRYETSDDYTYLTYEVNPKGVTNKIYPVITDSRDSLGNINTNSWGASEGGGWSDVQWKALEAGTTVTFTISAADPNEDAMQYMFMIQPDGGSFESLRGWSSQNTFTWTVPEDYVGTNIYILTGVKDSDSYLLFGDMGDDYTYLMYSVN